MKGFLTSVRVMFVKGFYNSLILSNTLGGRTMKKKISVIIISAIIASAMPVMAKGLYCNPEICASGRVCIDCGSPLQQGVCTDCGKEQKLYKNMGQQQKYCGFTKNKYNR